MDRFIKKNIVLISVLSASAVLVLGLLVFAIVQIVQLYQYDYRTEKARDEVKKLVNQPLAPGKENEDRKQRDIVFYQQRTAELLQGFQSPLQPAVEAFLKKLPPPDATLLKKSLEQKEKAEEIQNFKEPGTGETNENGVEIPLKIRHLEQASFTKLYSLLFEAEVKNNQLKDEQTLLIRHQNSVISELQTFFIDPVTKNSMWDDAVKAFVAEVQKLTLEPLNNNNQTALLLYAMGLPRSIDDSNFHSYMKEYAKTLSAKAKPMVIEQPARDFLVKTGKEATQLEVTLSDYAEVLFHWDVFGDLVQRFSRAKIVKIKNISVRKYEADAKQEGDNLIKLGRTYEDSGDYRLYHYSVEVEGTMESLRKAVAELDKAVENKRFYIVRAVYLYAQFDEAAQFMGTSAQKTNQDQEQFQEQPPDQYDSSIGQHRFRRRRSIQEPQIVQDLPDNAEAKDAERDEREQADLQRKPNERDNYGNKKIGKQTTCRAVIDLDYVVLKPKQ